MLGLLQQFQDRLRGLAAFLDRPGFPWKNLIIGFTAGQYVFENFLLFRQYNVYKRTVPPKAIANQIDQKTYDKSQAYGRSKAKFSFVNSTISLIKSIGLYHFDVYPILWNITSGFITSYFPTRFTGEITQSLVFFFAFSITDTILSLPLSYYQSFVLEEKYGFNKMTVSLWLTDLVKSQALGIALGGPIGAAFLAIIKKTGDAFFFYLWLFMLTVQLVAITIYPIVIVPLFNKLTPLEPGSLKESIDALAGKLKFPLSELQVIDGSKRSSHSNAYFTGLPWKKKIVIFDTLLEQSSDEEVVAVLAHELGHWKMGHTTSLLGVAQVHMFSIFLMFSAFIQNRSLYSDFGFTKEQPIIMGLLLFNDVFVPLDCVIKFLMNLMTRKFEYEADRFALLQGYAKPLARALIKLQITNLSSMDADGWYSSYHYSHPILTERLKAMNWSSDEKIEVPKASSKETEKSEDASVSAATGREL
ncbi:hypothetical protein K402DRAFT_457359 [Aulographum hederae CBS 113979]|uniref:CAAX prenyl protease n=1 Tax=Aulographum hederae CBS 113979 TaxID=1176131 RepID=A0A6G1GN37_9PEZI|nr:hypothetical protein K402DRAFT_457359 [Aulographum hederae CBS 113979]